MAKIKPIIRGSINNNPKFKRSIVNEGEISKRNIEFLISINSSVNNSVRMKAVI